MSRRGYRDLIAWQKAMDLAENVYGATQAWPEHERFGITAQIRRAAVSVASNVAEGQGRNSDNELGRFAGIAHGSLCELETQLLLAHRLAYVDEATARSLIVQAEEVGRLLQGLMRRLRH